MDVHVTSSCGAEYLDQVAIDAFKAVGPLEPPPPAEIFKNGAEYVHLPFKFALQAVQRR